MNVIIHDIVSNAPTCSPDVNSSLLSNLHLVECYASLSTCTGMFGNVPLTEFTLGGLVEIHSGSQQ